MENEKYAFVQVMELYGPVYGDERMPAIQEELNKRLRECLDKLKPSEYRIVNAQVNYFSPTDEMGSYNPPIVQHIIHIAYKE